MGLTARPPHTAAFLYQMNLFNPFPPPPPCLVVIALLHYGSLGVLLVPINSPYAFFLLAVQVLRVQRALARALPKLTLSDR